MEAQGEQEDAGLGELEEDDDLLGLLIEKEVLVQHLDTSKVFIEGKIQRMETDINKAIQNEWKEHE